MTKKNTHTHFHSQSHSHSHTYTHTKVYEKTQKTETSEAEFQSSETITSLGLYLIFYCTYIFTHDLDYFQCNRLILPVFFFSSLFTYAFFQSLFPVKHLYPFDNIHAHTNLIDDSTHIRICMYADAHQTSGNFELVVIHRCCCVAWVPS